MLLKDKKILIMGIRNKWSIAWGAAIVAAQQGAKVIVSYNSENNLEKINELIKEIPGAKAYQCDVSKDDSIEKCLEEIKQDYGMIDGILHSIAHANTEDMRNDFIKTQRGGFSHAMDVSAYSLVAISRVAMEKQVLSNNSSIVALSYFGAEKAVVGYNVMGAAKAALESSIRYLAIDLGKFGIRINAISAGPIKTLSAKGIKDFNNILNVIEEKAPLHRNITAKQVGNVVAFLHSDLSEAITGEVIHVDNGYSIMGV